MVELSLLPVSHCRAEPWAQQRFFSEPRARSDEMYSLQAPTEMRAVVDVAGLFAAGG